MATTVQDPQALNNILVEIVTALLNGAEDEFQDRTGRSVDVSRVQKMKVHAANRLAGLAMKGLNRVEDPQERLQKLADLTNRYLPGIVEVVGEDAVRARLDKLPQRLRNQDVVKLFQDAGAVELARLLGGGAVAAAAVPVAAVPVAAAATPPKAATPKASPPVTPHTEPESGGAPDHLALLKSQLAMLEAMRLQIDEAIPRLLHAIEEESAALRSRRRG